MSSYAGLDEMDGGNGMPKFDAEVHFAAVPRILIKPDIETSGHPMLLIHLFTPKNTGYL